MPPTRRRNQRPEEPLDKDLMRFAVYFIPGPGLLRTLATAWLGYDIIRGVECKRPQILTSLVPDIDVLTAAPRRYGLHATVKAPFRPVATFDTADLLAAVEAFCRTLRPIIVSGLAIAEINGFFCLRPVDGSGETAWLAASAVREFDRFRAPLHEEERRRYPDLSLRERELLERWGYPYVMELFRFHITLTNFIPDPEQRLRLRSILEDYLAEALEQPLVIDSLCLMVERRAGCLFELIQCHQFRNTSVS